MIIYRRWCPFRPLTRQTPRETGDLFSSLPPFHSFWTRSLPKNGDFSLSRFPLNVFYLHFSVSSELENRRWVREKLFPPHLSSDRELLRGRAKSLLPHLLTSDHWRTDVPFFALTEALSVRSSFRHRERAFPTFPTATAV